MWAETEGSNHKAHIETSHKEYPPPEARVSQNAIIVKSA